MRQRTPANFITILSDFLGLRLRWVRTSQSDELVDFVFEILGMKRIHGKIGFRRLAVSSNFVVISTLPQ